MSLVFYNFSLDITNEHDNYKYLSPSYSFSWAWSPSDSFMYQQLLWFYLVEQLHGIPCVCIAYFLNVVVCSWTLLLFLGFIIVNDATMNVEMQMSFPDCILRLLRYIPGVDLYIYMEAQFLAFWRMLFKKKKLDQLKFPQSANACLLTLVCVECFLWWNFSLFDLYFTGD